MIELEVTGALSEQLVNAVKPLEEDRRALVGVLTEVTTTLTKLVPKRQPLSLHQNMETLHREDTCTGTCMYIHACAYNGLPLNSWNEATSKHDSSLK